MTTLLLRSEHITLAQALKAAGLADTGGQAKFLIREHQATVNGQIETRPSRKLVAGDHFGILGQPDWAVSS
jgi:ribosome-associated protein